MLTLIREPADVSGDVGGDYSPKSVVPGEPSFAPEQARPRTPSSGPCVHART